MNPSDPSALDAFDRLVRVRRTSLKVDPAAPVPPDLVERLLGLATWAPNHKRTWPWRFTVLTGAARERLGELVAGYEQGRGAEPARVDKARGKYLRSPVVILVGAAGQPDPVRRREDRDAVAAGVQTLLLGATAAGLASHWATGDWMEDPAVRSFAALGPDDELVALVYLGWPNAEVPLVDRPPPAVTWLDG